MQFSKSSKGLLHQFLDINYVTKHRQTHYAAVISGHTPKERSTHYGTFSDAEMFFLMKTANGHHKEESKITVRE